jgi:hypothetical protein
LQKIVKEEVEVVIDNEWGIEIEDSNEQGEVKETPKVENTTSMNLDDLKNQLGSLFKK